MEEDTIPDGGKRVSRIWGAYTVEVVVFLYICTAGGSPPSILAVNSTQALRGPRADRILRPFDIDSALPSTRGCGPAPPTGGCSVLHFTPTVQLLRPVPRRVPPYPTFHQMAHRPVFHSG